MTEARPLSPALRSSVLLLAAVFAALAALFLAMPAAGALLFGRSSTTSDGLFYVRAVGVRDLGLAGWLAAMAFRGDSRSLFTLLVATAAIPMGDAILLLAAGTGRPVHYALHLASLGCFAGLALWVRCLDRASTRQRRQAKLDAFSGSPRPE